MPQKEKQRSQPEVQPPQYEDFRSGNWLCALLQWLGGIGAVFVAVVWLLLPEWEQPWGKTMLGLEIVFLLLFLVPWFQSRKHARENQKICIRNRRKYDQYRSALKEEQKEKT